MIGDRLRKILSDPARALSLFLSVGLRSKFRGLCTVCGKESIFIRKGLMNLRENFICENCGSNSRNRHLALTLCNLYGDSSQKEKSLTSILKNLSALSIYEVSASGPVNNILKRLDNHTSSEYSPERALETGADRVENLEQTSFADGSFDLIISQDVFEHIRDTDKAFKEVGRILRPGGRHIFTVPFNPAVLTYRPSGEKIPAHKDGEEIIEVQTVFGSDLIDILKKYGFSTDIYLSVVQLEKRYRIYWSRVFVSLKSI